MRQNAEAGLPAGGGYRPFGFEDDRRTIRPSEAASVRAVAKRLLAGQTLRSVTAWLNETGVATVTGKRWKPNQVRAMAINPRYAGLRAVGNGANARVVADAVWKPIITRAQHDQLRALLLDPARRTNRSARKYLLTGLVRCSRCDAAMVARPKYGRRQPDGTLPSVPAYACSADHGGCGRMLIRAEGLEARIVGMAAAQLARPEVQAALTVPGGQMIADPAVLEELGDVEARRARLAERYASGDLSDAEWDAARSTLVARQAALSAQVRRANRVPAVLAQVARRPERLAKDWPGFGFDEQRAIVTGLLEAVVIGPARPGTNGFDPDRISDVRWADVAA
jgi:hypothetical protein